MANSGSGYILFGVKSDGSNSGWDCSLLTTVDPAQLTGKIATYTGEQFSEFEVQEVDRGGSRVAMMVVLAVHIPLIFVLPGTYDVGGGKQKTAFGKGTIYFGHGAKSEPGTSQDIRQSVQREIETIRRSWLGNIRKVVTAPRGHEVRVLPPEVLESALESATPIRLVDDPARNPPGLEQSSAMRITVEFALARAPEIRRGKAQQNSCLLCSTSLICNLEVA